MAVIVGYQGTVTSWASQGGGAAIDNAALLALSQYNEYEITVDSDTLDTTRFRTQAATGPAAGVYEGLNGVRGWSGIIRGLQAARVPGYIGDVTLASGYDANPHMWSLVLRGLSLNTTAFNPSAGWRASAAGIINWSGEFSCWLDDTEVLTLNNLYSAPITPTFTLASGNTLSGSAHINSTRISAQVQDRTLVTFGYQGTSDLTSVGSANVIPADTSLAPFSASSLVITYSDTSGTDRTLTGSAFPTSVQVRCDVNGRTETEIGFQGTGALSPA